eukprot:COSAG01_NODE_1322_length_10736_cov_26.418257_1_plen_86_part_10
MSQGARWPEVSVPFLPLPLVRYASDAVLADEALELRPLVGEALFAHLFLDLVHRNVSCRSAAAGASYSARDALADARRHPRRCRRG